MSTLYGNKTMHLAAFRPRDQELPLFSAQMSCERPGILIGTYRGVSIHGWFQCEESNLTQNDGMIEDNEAIAWPCVVVLKFFLNFAGGWILLCASLAKENIWFSQRLRAVKWHRVCVGLVLVVPFISTKQVENWTYIPHLRKPHFVFFIVGFQSRREMSCNSVWMGIVFPGDLPQWWWGGRRGSVSVPAGVW